MNTNKIWIIGASGMLGSELSNVLTEAGIDHFGTDREVSILEPEALEAKFNEAEPSWIVNCSAYTAVDKAEDEEELAYRLNRDGIANIARLAADHDVPVIHISTDYVFDGTSAKPLKEDAPTGPGSVYGESKLAGEKVLRSLCKKHIIIRTAWLYGQYGSNFVYKMIKLMNGRESIRVVDDQHGSPTWTRDLAELIVTVIKSENPAWGTFHYSNEEETTWCGFAQKIYEYGKSSGRISSSCEINPCATDEFPTKAKRPAYSLLSKEKVKRELGVNVPSWEESLGKFLEGISGLHSRVSNWLEHAEYDLETAKAMHNCERYLYVAVMCQQCIEKSMKAVYEFRGRNIPRIHDLNKLSYKEGLLDQNEYKKLLNELTYYYIASRYNERIEKLSAEIDSRRSTDFINRSEEAWLCLKSMIPLF